MTARQKAIEEWLKVGPRYPMWGSREWACFGFSHIVVDDDNTDDGCIQWCIKEGETNREEYRDNMSDELMDETLELLRSLLLIPEEEEDG